MFGQMQTAMVIGVGIIGGSFAGALKQSGKFKEVIGIDVRETVLDELLQSGYIDKAGSNLNDFIDRADFVVLATPVRESIRLITDLAPLLKSGAILMDICSTKSHVTQAMNALPSRVAAIGGHPMTGPMTLDVVGPDPNMFDKRIFILTPNERTGDGVLLWCKSLLEEIGAYVFVIDAEQHDRMVAIVSHLPRLVPIALLDIALNDQDNTTAKLAAGGFRESTRKATENLNMWIDVIMTNPTHIVRAIRSLQSSLDSLIQVVESGDQEKIHSLLTNADSQWEQLFGTENH
jgi:prephenate dehydrogenase